VSYVHPEFLVETEWVADHLTDSDLRILDCTVFGRAVPPTDYITESGRAHYEQGHIPGAAFADVINDLSDTSSPFLLMAPSAEKFAQAMGALGVGDGTRVVTYDADRGLNIWAARVSWLLRAFGFESAAVLNGGWKKWTLEGRPVSTEPASYPPTTFTPRPRPERIASKDEVHRYVEQGGACLVNALPPNVYRGELSMYARPGRIPTSLNVPETGLVNPNTGAFLPAEEIRTRFESAGVLRPGRIVTYCAGGVAASADALLLTMLGAEDVAVYDGSMNEWTADPAMPVEVG
jgi:thiosulfate/3-mercaptopyruvate sulfurtransferase